MYITQSRDIYPIYNSRMAATILMLSDFFESSPARIAEQLLKYRNLQKKITYANVM